MIALYLGLLLAVAYLCDTAGDIFDILKGSHENHQSH